MGLGHYSADVASVLAVHFPVGAPAAFAVASLDFGLRDVDYLVGLEQENLAGVLNKLVVEYQHAVSADDVFPQNPLQHVVEIVARVEVDVARVLEEVLLQNVVEELVRVIEDYLSSVGRYDIRCQLP